MQKRLFQKAKTAVLGFLLITTCALPSYAAESPKNKINEWMSACPYIGLVSKEVTYGPVTLKRFDLENQGRVVIAKPGEKINGTVHYKVKASELESFCLHHIIIGIKGEDAQSCLTHALGVWDKKGKANFSMIAPTKKGVYEVRFDYQTGLTCGEASNRWNDNPPSSSATVGIIIVE